MKFEKAVDILEVAVRIERHSVEFYVKLLGAVTSARAAELFSLLAAEEEKHLGRTRFLLERVADYLPRYEYPGEYELFVDGMARRSTDITGVPESISGEIDAVGAITAAAAHEQRVAAFYSGQLDWFRGDVRLGLNELIGDEAEHLEKLQDLLRTYPADGTD